MGGFYLVVELQREGSAPAACTAGLFSYKRFTGRSLVQTHLPVVI